MKPLNFEVKFIPAGTGSAVWDDPHADQLIQRFMPHGRDHGPMIGILHLGAVRPTPGVLRDVVVGVGQDVRAGRYGDFAFIISSEDEPTRRVIGDVAAAHDLAIFLSSSPTDLEHAEPAGSLTERERDTMRIVLLAGGTVSATQLAEALDIEQTTAGNRLVALQKKGFLQRVRRPHPIGDLFVDPRSIRFSGDSKQVDATGG